MAEEQTKFGRSRRRFLANMSKSIGAFALLAAGMPLESCSSISEFERRNLEAQRISHEYFDKLTAQDSFVGVEGLEGLFQKQYDLRVDSELRLRSAPSIAQLPYPIIVDMLNANSSKKIVMLYPGGGQDIAPLLFGHLLHKLFSGISFKAIYSEIDDIFPGYMMGQLGWLKRKGVIDFGQDKIKKPGVTLFQFEIKTRSGKMMIEYRIRPPSDEYFTHDDADEANLFRENYTFDGENNQAFIAEMAKKGSRQGKPVLIMFPDYDRLGNYFNGKMGFGYDDANNSYTMPDRFISKIELRVLEEQFGPRTRGITYDDVKDDKSRPLKDVPGDFFLSRGYVACSCNGCMDELGKRHQQHFENQRYVYAVLYKPEHLDDFSQDELTMRLEAAFKTTPKPEIQIYRCNELP